MNRKKPNKPNKKKGGKKEEEEEELDFDDEDLKMVFVVRMDLKMGAGKIAAQVAHAAVGLYDDITNGDDNHDKQALDYWNTFGSKKIVLKGENLEVLSTVAQQCKNDKIPYIMISDAGHTQVPAGSVTVLGIGPVESDRINKYTGTFKLMH